MKRFFLPILSAVLLLATDRPGVRPRGAAKDYPAYDKADGITIAAAVVPAGKVQHQLSPALVKSGYTVIEIAVYPDPGKDVIVSSDDFSMTAGSSQDVARAETPQVVASALDSDKRMDPPRLPPPVQVHGEETIGVSTGGRDPVTGRRYPSSVYTESGVGVGVGDPRSGAPPPDNPGMGGAQPQSVYDRLQQKALPEGKTTKAVAGYLYFPKVSPRLVNSTDPYHLTYQGPTEQIHLTIPAEKR
jgi:hypothetical protein